MKRLALILPAVALAFVLGAITFAQTNTVPWPYFAEVTPPAAAGLHQFAVPLHVLDKAREDLADLRLYDANSHEIPYAVRTRSGNDKAEEVEGRLFNQATIGSTASEVSVDLGENAGEHNEIEIETEGINFRRSVEVEAGDTPANWKTLAAGDVIFSFGTNSSARSKRVSYPTSRYRYLRVRVFADAPREKQPPVVSGVKVLMSRREQGQITTWRVVVPSMQLLRHHAAPASAWTFDLGMRLPCDRLVLTTSEESFSRPFEVEVIDDPNDIRLIASGELTRRRGDESQLTINFDQEVHARRLRLVVTDHSNPPLSIYEMQAGAPLRQVFFDLKEPATQPLRLYFGNPNAVPPRYDFEKELQSRLNQPALAGAAGVLIKNPDYQPPPLPFTERVPWLIYLVLTVSSVALGLILLSLARATMKNRADNPQPS